MRTSKPADANGMQNTRKSRPVASVIIGSEQMAPLEQNVQAALNFTPISESGKQKLQEKVAPLRAAWEKFLETHQDSLVV